ALEHEYGAMAAPEAEGHADDHDDRQRDHELRGGLANLANAARGMPCRNEKCEGGREREHGELELAEYREGVLNAPDVREEHDGDGAHQAIGTRLRLEGRGRGDGVATGGWALESRGGY